MIQTPMPASRNIISVELTAPANTVLTETAKWSGLKKKNIIERMMDWYAVQDIEVRKVVLGHIPASMMDEAKEMAIRKMAAAPESEKLDTVELTHISKGVTRKSRS